MNQNFVELPQINQQKNLTQQKYLRNQEEFRKKNVILRCQDKHFALSDFANIKMELEGLRNKNKQNSFFLARGKKLKCSPSPYIKQNYQTIAKQKSRNYSIEIWNRKKTEYKCISSSKTNNSKKISTQRNDLNYDEYKGNKDIEGFYNINVSNAEQYEIHDYISYFKNHSLYK